MRITIEANCSVWPGTMMHMVTWIVDKKSGKLVIVIIQSYMAVCNKFSGHA